MLKDEIYTIIWSKRNADGSPGWCSRTEIARTLGRAGYTLNVDDKTTIAHLVSKGLIESRHERIVGGNGWRGWEYRAIDSADAPE